MLAPFEVIERVAPVSAEGDVSVSRAIEVLFRQDIEPSSLNSSSFVLMDEQGQKVAGEVFYERRKATFQPSSSLSVSTRYRAAVIGGPAGVRTIFGKGMAVDFIWNFTTGEDEALPAPQLKAPQHQSKTADVTPELRWLKVSGAHGYEIEIARDKSFAALYYSVHVPDIESEENIVAHVPGTPLQSTQNVSSIFYWRVRAVGESGSPGLWSEVWQFNNATYKEPASAFHGEYVDVLSAFPSSGSYGTSPEKIALFFSEPLDGAEFEIEVEMEDL